MQDILQSVFFVSQNNGHRVFPLIQIEHPVLIECAFQLIEKRAVIHIIQRHEFRGGAELHHFLPGYGLDIIIGKLLLDGGQQFVQLVWVGRFPVHTPDACHQRRFSLCENHIENVAGTFRIVNGAGILFLHEISDALQQRRHTVGMHGFQVDGSFGNGIFPGVGEQEFLGPRHDRIL